MATRAVIAALEGRGLHSQEMRELLDVLHLATYAIGKLKDAAEELLDDDEDRR